MGNTILKMQNITKVFPGVKALDQVNIEVAEGEIHAICGENGAGKSTLMNVLSGIYPYGSYEGEVIYQDQECRFHNIKDSERKGIVSLLQSVRDAGLVVTDLETHQSSLEDIFVSLVSERTPGRR